MLDGGECCRKEANGRGVVGSIKSFVNTIILLHEDLLVSVLIYGSIKE